MRIYLEEDQGSLVFLQDGEEIYHIPIRELGDILQDGTSDWINQLADKSWITSYVLHQVVTMIKKHHPDSSIDWQKTNMKVDRES